MLNLISAILFSFSANLDNIAIGISYGIKKIHIPNITTFFIAIFTTVFTLISMLLGKYIILFLNENLANSIGSYFLMLLGIIYIIKEILESFKKKQRSNTKNDIIQNKNKDIINIKIKELTIIVFTLSINNIGAGIAASATGINVFLTCIFSFLSSFVFLIFGNNLGKKVINIYIEKYCNIISAIILILIGFIQL